MVAWGSSDDFFSLINETALQKLWELSHDFTKSENFPCKLLISMLLICVFSYRFLILFRFSHIYISKGNFQLQCHMHRLLFCSALACRVKASPMLRFVSQLVHLVICWLDDSPKYFIIVLESCSGTLSHKGLRYLVQGSNTRHSPLMLQFWTSWFHSSLISVLMESCLLKFTYCRDRSS